MEQIQVLSELDFLKEGGDMGALIRTHDWNNNALGNPSLWPQSLRTALSLCLNSPIISALYWGADLRMLYNDAYAPALADRHPVALGMPFREVWREIWDVLGVQLVSVIDSGKGISTPRQRLIMHRNGVDEETYWFYSFAPVRGEGGRIAGVFVSAMDITGQVHVENALAQNHESLQTLNSTLEQQVARKTADRNTLWQLSSDLMLIAKFDGVITAVNPAWTTVLGWSEDELIGINLFDLIHPEDVARTISGAADIGKGGHQLRRFENRYRCKDDSYRWITWTAGPNDGSIVAVGRDDTDEKDKAEELSIAHAQLRQSQKMEAVGQLTGGLAHDFNNLLQAIMGNLELLQMKLSSAKYEDLPRYIQSAQGAGRRASALTQRLLAFSRRQTLDPKSTDVNRLITGLEEMLRRTVGPAIHIEVINAVGLWNAMIDAAQLENALLNLCINARDAMPNGGRLTIETANKWLDDRAAKECDVAPGQYLSICVTDTGVGMTADIVDRAIEPFFTTKPIGEGTGLGLSMIYGFARQSLGQVRIYSEVGQGTTVCIYLPRYFGAAMTDEAEKGKDSLPTAAGVSVLIIDDEASVRFLIEEVLTELGYVVLSAADGAAGLKILRENRGIELLITDVGLPNGMNGRQVADYARIAQPELKILFITGYAENAAVGNGHLEHGMELLTKPFALDQMGKKVADILKLV
jgi:PAS domain S-box-containing protein